MSRGESVISYARPRHGSGLSDNEKFPLTTHPLHVVYVGFFLIAVYKRGLHQLVLAGLYMRRG